MPHAQSKMLFERYFNFEGLPNELREKILSNLTVNELLAFECVSKRWQINISGVLTEIKVVTVLFRDRRTLSSQSGLYYPDFDCSIQEHSPITTIMTRYEEGRDQVIKLLARMTNLVAVGLPGHWQSDDLMAALKNCSKLEHIAVSVRETCRGPVTVVISDELCSRLTCLSTVNQMSYKTIKKMTSLKRYDNPHGYIPLDELTFQLKNGLVSVSGNIEYKDIETVCQLGFRLETLDVNFITLENNYGMVFLSSDDVRRMVHSLRRLKKLKVIFKVMDSLALLKDLERLEDLFIWIIDEDEGDVFKDAMKIFGHRLKVLRVVSLRNKSLIADLAVACPNLESLTIRGNLRGAADVPIDSERAGLFRLSKLRILNFDFTRWKNEEVVEFLDGFPNLRKVVVAKLSEPVDVVKNLKHLVASNFPDRKIDVVGFSNF